MDWDELCGERELRAIKTDVRHPFDADASGVALDLGDITVFAFENPSDGYRSCAASLLIAKGSLYEFGCSPDYLRVPVLISRWTKSEGGYEADGVEFRDKRNGKVILVLGTDNSNDDYPSFTCDWRPQDLADNAVS